MISRVFSQPRRADGKHAKLVFMGVLLLPSRDGRQDRVPLTRRIDTTLAVEHYKHGGILPWVLRELLATA